MLLDVQGREVYAYTGSRPLVAAQPVVVFVHGAASDHSVWALQSRYFAHHGFNALAVDLPGHGRSGGDPLSSVEAIADWLAALLDAAAPGRASLVGHSMGALATLECAARIPARIERIVLLGVAVPMEVSDDLIDAVRRDEHAAYALINGWSFSARRTLGGNAVPGLWMTGNSMRLLERSAAGNARVRSRRVPGLRERDARRCRGALPGTRHHRLARHHGAPPECACRAGGAAGCAGRRAPGGRTCADGRGARRRARRAARVSRVKEAPWSRRRKFFRFRRRAFAR